MKATAPARIRRKPETLNVLLDELGEECQRTLDLLGKLRGNRNSRIKRSDVLVELNASIVHLHAHTKGLPDLIYDEFDREEDD